MSEGRFGGISPAAFIVTAVLGLVTTGMWAVVALLYLRGQADAGQDAAQQASGLTLALTGILAKTGRSESTETTPTEPIAVTTNPGDFVSVEEKSSSD